MDPLTIPHVFTDGPGNTASGEQVSTNFSETEDKVNELVDAHNDAVRVLWGIVDSTGTISAGTGFTIVKGSSGIYTINFTVAFGAGPAVTAICDLGNVAPSYNSPSVSSIQLRWDRTTDGVPLDTSFHFHAIGSQ